MIELKITLVGQFAAEIFDCQEKFFFWKRYSRKRKTSSSLMPKYLCQSLSNNQYMLSEMPSLSDGMVLSSSNGSKWYDNDMPVYWINSHQMGHLWFSGWIVEEPFMYAIVLVFLFCLCIFSQFLYWFITKKFDFMKKPTNKPQGEEYAYLEGYVKIIFFMKVLITLILYFTIFA